MLLKGMSGSSKPERALPLDLRLQAIADNVPTSTIDEVWVFPPLPDRDIACEFLVLLCYDGGPDRRRVLTSHVDARRADPEAEEFEWVQRLREHGTAPHEWVSGMPDRLLHRLADAGTPEVIEVCGQAEVWDDVVKRMGERNGNGNGHGDAFLAESALIDSQATSRITFSTINETAVTASATGITVDCSDPESDS